MCATSYLYINLAGNAALNALEGKDIKTGVREDLSSAKKDIAKQIRKFPATYNKETKKKEGDKKISTAKKGKKGNPSTHSNIAKRKKIVKTILD